MIDARAITESRALRILVYGINYLPELTGIGKYTGEMSEWLSRRGHQVYAVCAVPYYPQWQVPEAYRDHSTGPKYKAV